MRGSWLFLIMAPPFPPLSASHRFSIDAFMTSLRPSRLVLDTLPPGESECVQSPPLLLTSRRNVSTYQSTYLPGNINVAADDVLRPI